MSNKKTNLLFDNFYKIISNRKNIFFLLIFIAPILFQKYFENLFNDYITKPIFLNIESNIYVDFLATIFVFILVIYYYYKFKKGYALSSFKSYLVFIFTFWYIVYRIKGEWYYQSFSFCPFFFYSDIFLIIPIAYISFLCINHSPNSLIIKTNEGFLVDQSINSPEEDTLGRKEYAKAIANKIEKSFPSDTLAIAITGKWGSGKTSFIQLIENNLTQQPIIINFNSRKNHDSNNIIIDFFDELEARLGIYNENLSFSIHQYLKQLTTVDDNIYFKTIDFLTNIIFGKKSTQDMFKEIDKTIRNIGRQVVIFMDDIDRLDSKEIIEIIKLIRFTANFKNTVFLVAFDKGYVINAINEFNNYEKEWFLEKIFQVEFPLPTFETNTLKRKLEEKLISNFPENETEFKNYFADESNILILDKCILTMRDVIRFTNVFSLDFSLVRENVLISDFINISLLKLKYFSVYELIFFEPNGLFHNTISGSAIEFDMTNTLNSLFLMTIDEKALIERIGIKKNINYFFKDTISEKSDIIKICLHIFNKHSKSSQNQLGTPANSLNKLSISVPSQFLIYSSMRILEGQISMIDFAKARQGTYEDFVNKVDEWFDKGSKNHITVLFRLITTYDNFEDCQKIIKILFYQSSKRFSFENTDFDFIEITIQKIFIANKYFNINVHYQKFIKKLFDSSEFKVELKAFLLRAINDDAESFDQDNFVLNPSQRLSLLLTYFKSYVQTEEELFTADFWKMYDFCLYKQNNITKIQPEVNELVKSVAIKGNLTRFLEQIFIWKYFTQYDNHSLYETLFPNKSDFYDFYKSIESSESKKEAENFYHNNRNNNKILFGLDQIFYWLKE